MILYEILMIDYRWLSEKYAAVVARKRYSPQAIVVSRVQARPIQIETRERLGSCFCLAVKRFPLPTKQLACGDLSGIGLSWYRWFPREILFVGTWGFARLFLFHVTPAERMLPSADSRRFSSAEKAEDKQEKRRDPSRAILGFMPDPAAPRRRIRTGRTRP